MRIWGMGVGSKVELVYRVKSSDKVPPQDADLPVMNSITCPYETDVLACLIGEDVESRGMSAVNKQPNYGLLHRSEESKEIWRPCARAQNGDGCLPA